VFVRFHLRLWLISQFCLIVKKKLTCMFDFSWNNRARACGERERETRQRKFKPVELRTRAHACHRRCKMFLEKNGGKREKKKKKTRARLETIVLPACENLNWWQRSSVLKLITAWQVDIRTHRHGSWTLLVLKKNYMIWWLNSWCDN